MSKILIAGGSGLIGQNLTKHLMNKGHEVVLLSRKPDSVKQFSAFHWNPIKGEIDEACLEAVDYVINLAGAGIADKRWTATRKKLIIESRTKGAELLRQLISKSAKPKRYIAASAIGFYGNRGPEKLNEQSQEGSGFLSESTIAWEAASKSIEQTGVPVDLLRIGIVLSTKGGALAKMLLSFNFKLGSYFGDGSQIYSWIHIDDVVGIIDFLLERDSGQGEIYNTVAPNPVSNKALIHAINSSGNFGALVIPAPSLAMKLALGEMSTVILNGNHVDSSKLLKLGYSFEWPTIKDALKDIIENRK